MYTDDDAPEHQPGEDEDMLWVWRTNVTMSEHVVSREAVLAEYHGESRQGGLEERHAGGEGTDHDD